jgi:hypothetical protein
MRPQAALPFKSSAAALLSLLLLSATVKYFLSPAARRIISYLVLLLFIRRVNNINVLSFNQELNITRKNQLILENLHFTDLGFLNYYFPVVNHYFMSFVSLVVFQRWEQICLSLS